MEAGRSSAGSDDRKAPGSFRSGDDALLDSGHALPEDAESLPGFFAEAIQPFVHGEQSVLEGVEALMGPALSFRESGDPP